MKKKLFLSISAILTALFVILGANYLLSLKKVSFTLDKTVKSISIYSSKKQEIKQLTSSDSISLTSGSYYIIPKGENISNKPTNFTIDNKDITVTISPDYSDRYLQELLKKEFLAISAATTTKYPSLISDFTLTHGTLYRRGEWFGGLLEPKVSDIREQKDPYRIVLHKKDGKWQVIRRPEYILTSARYKEVPIDVLREINLIAK